MRFFESVAKLYGGEFKDFKFDFKNNPEGLEQLRNALGNPGWFKNLVREWLEAVYRED